MLDMSTHSATQVQAWFPACRRSTPLRLCFVSDELAPPLPQGTTQLQTPSIKGPWPVSTVPAPSAAPTWPLTPPASVPASVRPSLPVLGSGRRLLLSVLASGRVLVAEDSLADSLAVVLPLPVLLLLPSWPADVVELALEVAPAAFWPLLMAFSWNFA